MACLGLDVGGTSCRYEWWPEGAHPGGRAAGVQPAVHGLEATVRGLLEVCSEAARTAPPEAAVLAVAGAGDAELAAALTAGLRAGGVTFPVRVVGDVLAAAATALHREAGVLLWSGTGSFAVARDRDGRLHRVGGRGYLLGDQGSGYDLVRRAAAAVLLAVDGLGPQTALADSLPPALGASAPERVGAVLQSLDTASAVRQLPVVVEAAAAGDAVATEIFAAGAESLALLANAAARSAGLELGEVAVTLGGGVMHHVPPLVAQLVDRLGVFGVEATRTVDELAAARGAAWLADGVHRRLEPQSSWVQRVTL